MTTAKSLLMNRCFKYCYINIIFAISMFITIRIKFKLVLKLIIFRQNYSF